jgi:hypothetical protein
MLLQIKVCSKEQEQKKITSISEDKHWKKEKKKERMQKDGGE